MRPIAIGCTLCRLAAKAIGSQLKSRMGGLLMPRQLGYGTSRGCEVVVHAVRMYLHQLSPASTILKLDFSNAFNSIRHDTMLKAVGDLAPELLHFVYTLYTVHPPPCSGKMSACFPVRGFSRGTLWVPCCSALPFTSCLFS